MKAVALQGAKSTGHECFPPSKDVGPYSTKTTINGKPIMLVGRTLFMPHNCGSTVHLGPMRMISEGATKTFIEGQAVARIMDKIACGDMVGGPASKNTFAE